MINFNEVDFSEPRSKKVISFFFSVINTLVELYTRDMHLVIKVSSYIVFLVLRSTTCVHAFMYKLCKICNKCI